ncbi:CvpA family protein [Coxiella endosymbiont of Amblyomma nuttalli]|uniref:CvpA family protein n=1 Tax=Coxiella endosymbiont of Amblyomma nuttalli TaxID=2749996 RepID=UPI001BA575BC|nr:CvpA family protein [Coxiella endosymbiont of Amblyomma nuttalli]QTS84089.1 Colicin V production protein [Coxiella endosymbiont of Amblyomma nuttalli]
MSYFNWVDFTIIGIVFFSIVIGVFRGFLREVVSLITWIAAVVVAFKYVNFVQVDLKSWITSDSVRYATTLIGLFLTVFIIGMFLNMLVHALVNKSKFGIIDRLLGIFFGTVRGLLIIVILLMFINVRNIQDGSALAQSQLVPDFKPTVIWLKQFLPHQLKCFFQWLFNQTNECT